MTKSIESGVLGVGLGGLYGLLSLRLALIHRGSTVLNGAQGSFACLWGDAGLRFRRSHMQTGLGAVVAVVTSAAFGVLTNQLGTRSMRGSSYLTKVMATLGLRIFWEDFVGWRIKGWFKEVNGFFPIRPISALDGSPIFRGQHQRGRSPSGRSSPIIPRRSYTSCHKDSLHCWHVASWLPSRRRPRRVWGSFWSSNTAV